MLDPIQENDVEKEFQIHRTEEDYALAEFWKWTLAFMIGVTMGCIGFIVDWGINTLNNFKYYHTVGLISSRGSPSQASYTCPVRCPPRRVSFTATNALSKIRITCKTDKAM